MKLLSGFIRNMTTGDSDMLEVNVVNYFGVTIIDLREDTVTPADLRLGITAHAADGTIVTGSLQNLDNQSF